MNEKKNIFFLGIGGIGMSALARYYNAKGYKVAGYDRTPSELTKALETEGIPVHYVDDVRMIPADFREPLHTQVVYTPAVPQTMSEMEWFLKNGFDVRKRSVQLGEVTRSGKALCVSGTHGKTTVSTMLAHLLHNSSKGCSAFLGGISKNYDTNLLISDKSNFVVVEADEYDHSFLTLSPYMAVITAVDADHLDVYGTVEEYRHGFEQFSSLVRPDGFLFMKYGLPIRPQLQSRVSLFTYSIEKDCFHAENIRIEGGEIIFDFFAMGVKIKNIQLGVPVYVNIENAVVAMAVAWFCGVKPAELRKGMASYRGVRRRFDFHIKTDKIVFLDDYAHHPQEIKSSIESIRLLYPDRKLTVVFQPHLYTRTRDLADDFASVLSSVDELILLDIYPAREEPIPGITSQWLLDKVQTANKKLMSKEELVASAATADYDMLMMLGAGDLDLLVPRIKKTLERRFGLD